MMKADMNTTTSESRYLGFFPVEVVVVEGPHVDVHRNGTRDREAAWSERRVGKRGDGRMQGGISRAGEGVLERIIQGITESVFERIMQDVIEGVFERVHLL